MRCFALNIALVAMCAPPALARASELASPLLAKPHALDVVPGSVALELDAAKLLPLRGEAHVTINDFILAPEAVGGEPQRVSLELQRIDVLAPDVQFVLGNALGREHEQLLPAPDVMLLGGEIAGRPGSQVFLSFSPHGTYGYVRDGDKMQVLSSGPFGAAQDILIYDPALLPANAIHWRDFVCQTADPEDIVQPEGGDDGGFPCRQVRLAIETDYEFTGFLFSGNTSAASSYVTTIVGAMSQIYTSQINLRFQLSFVRLWDNPSDPWTSGNTSAQLNQFQSVWNSTMGSVSRNLAHFLSGRNLGGGIAYLSVLCSSNSGYAVSSGLSGFFPVPVQNNNAQNWDIFVTTHETGHNLAAPHTHAYCPPVDQCAPSGFFGPCQSQQVCISNGTIMSYCHLCPSGMAGIQLAFHSASIQTMTNYLAGHSCNLTCTPNDLCANAPIVVAGSHSFSTINALTDGPDEPGACATGGYTQIGNDVWFRYAAQCTGNATISLCGANFNAKLGVYSNPCPTGSGQLLACSDDFCGTSPQVTVPVVFGSLYRIRIGGFFGATGTGTMAITCVANPAPCPPDVNNSGSVDINDLLAVIGAWGPCPAPCPPDIDSSGAVDINDLLAVIGGWGPCP